MIEIIFLSWVCPVCTWWLIPFLIGAWLLGWFFGGIDKKRLLKQINDLEQKVFNLRGKKARLEKVSSTLRTALDNSDSKNHVLREQHATLESRMTACTVANEKLVLEMKSFSTNKIEEIEVEEMVQEISFAQEQEVTVSEVLPDDGSDNVDMIIGERDLSNVPFMKDDFKIIEGIGPKIELILKAAKIDTWGKLSDVSLDRLNQIMKTAGPRFEVNKPDSWPIQARYAEAGAWDKLVAYQRKLNLGKVVESKNSSSKLGRMFEA